LLIRVPPAAASIVDLTDWITIIKGLDNHPTLKTMMGAQMHQIFKMLSGFIERLILFLHEVGDLIP